MHNQFIRIPERQAGYPLVLIEARKAITVGRWSARDWLALSKREVAENMTHGSQYLLLKLACGELHSFAQDREQGWFRIPGGYWLDHRVGLLEAVTSFQLPEAIESRRYIEVPATLIGAPIVVWREDVEAMAARMAQEALTFLDAITENYIPRLRGTFDKMMTMLPAHVVPPDLVPTRGAAASTARKPDQGDNSDNGDAIAPTAAPKPRRRGPAEKWPWSRMAGALMMIAHSVDGLDRLASRGADGGVLPLTQADLERWARDWFLAECGNTAPAESQVRERIAPIFAGFEDRRA